MKFIFNQNEERRNNSDHEADRETIEIFLLIKNKEKTQNISLFIRIFLLFRVYMNIQLKIPW